MEEEYKKWKYIYNKEGITFQILPSNSYIRPKTFFKYIVFLKIALML